ncbi:MAG: agmatine deiminase family protein [Paracoccaceae bacterium]
MPAEYALHKRTWMMGPCRASIWPDMAATKRDDAAAAHMIAAFEPLTMAVRPQDMASLTLLGRILICSKCRWMTVGPAMPGQIS